MRGNELFRKDSSCVNYIWMRTGACDLFLHHSFFNARQPHGGIAWAKWNIFQYPWYYFVPEKPRWAPINVNCKTLRQNQTSSFAENRMLGSASAMSLIWRCVIENCNEYYSLTTFILLEHNDSHRCRQPQPIESSLNPLQSHFYYEIGS